MKELYSYRNVYILIQVDIEYFSFFTVILYTYNLTFLFIRDKTRDFYSGFDQIHNNSKTGAKLQSEIHLWEIGVSDSDQSRKSYIIAVVYIGTIWIEI